MNVEESIGFESMTYGQAVRVPLRKQCPRAAHALKLAKFVAGLSEKIVLTAEQRDSLTLGVARLADGFLHKWGYWPRS